MVPGVEFLNAWQAQAKRRVLSPQAAYEMALDADRTRDPQIEVGYRLYWMNEEILGSLDVLAQPSAYAVVGRHDSCDVVLDDELLVSLRHVLVRASSLDDGFPVLSVLDLQTSAGFELSDGSKQRSVAATGPIVFRIGKHSLVALPSTGRVAGELPVPVVERAEAAPHHVAAVAIPLQASVRDHDRDRAPTSRITLLPESVNFSQRPSMPLPPRDPSYVPTGEGYEVVLEGRDQRAGVSLSKADLEHGVLIGRAVKCVDAGLRLLLTDTVSRVHVLLIREKGACHLYDSGSRLGTFVDGDRVRYVPLEDSGTTVVLARKPGVTLHWRAL